VLLGHILNPEIAVFCQEKRKNGVFKKHGLKLAFFAIKFRLPHQKRANPGPYRAPLGSGTLLSDILIITSYPSGSGMYKKFPLMVSFFIPLNVITNK
jgi:hypothetical protein